MTMICGKHSSVAVAALVVSAAVLFAQSPGQPPPPDDPGLIDGFLRFHMWLVGANEQGNSTNALSAESREEEAAFVYRIDRPSVARITLVVRAVLVELKGLAAEEDAYLAPFMKERRLPDVARLVKFRERRVAMLRSALKGMQASLSPAAYQNVMKYINEEYRKNVRSGPVMTKQSEHGRF
jgi:hypothetical protein